MSDPGALGAEKNQTDASSSLLPEGLPSFEEVTRSMQVIHQSPIPDICHFFYTGKKNWPKILHPKVRDLRKIGFRDKIA